MGVSMKKEVVFYRKPAGGWDALRSSYQQVKTEGIVAKGALTLLRTNQPGGFDCPGCAWPDRNPNSTFEFCENGVKAVAAEATRKQLTEEFFQHHPVSWLLAQDDHFLEAQGRLGEPMAYDSDSDTYRGIDWDTAFAIIAKELNALQHPDEALFYTSGRTSNEAAFLYQLFVREFGTNNLPDCSNMCHEPSGVAMNEQIGIGKGTVTLEDFTQADAIFIFGQNPGTNHPRMLGELRDAAKRGCKIVVFNPLKERGLERFTHPQNVTEMLTGGSTAIAGHYYQPRIGGDLAVAKGLIKAVLESEHIDVDFIATHTDNFAALSADIAAESWSDIEASSGLGESQIRQAATIYVASNASIITWGMGITQHIHSVATIQMLINLLLLRGNIGKPGAGACPVRGHSNVQGDRTMGINEKPSDRFLDRLESVFDFTAPRKAGHDVIGAIQAMQEGSAKVFFALGGNFAAATPDTEISHAALRRCSLTVHVTTKLNRSHLVHGKQALILPCLGRTELDLQSTGPQSVTVEDSMSMVHLSRGINPPCSERLLSEPAIVARLAHATLKNSRTPWLWLIEDYDRIRDKISLVVEGFEDFNQRVRHPGGFYLGNSAREKQWQTIGNKARFLPHLLPDASMNREILPGLFQLMTVRAHDQYNTTIYGYNDRYRGIHGHRRVCFINKEDLEQAGFTAGEWVDITSRWSDGERVARRFLLVEYDIPRGCLASYFPETNVLMPLENHAARARTPASKSIPVRLSRSLPA